jgi:cation transport ATPase
MLAIPYLLLSFLAALVLVQHFFRELPALVRIVAAFAVSVVLTGWVNFLAAWLLHSGGRDDATFYGAFVAMLVNAVIIAAAWRDLRSVSFRVRPLELLGTGAALALSFWVMQGLRESRGVVDHLFSGCWARRRAG